jgi:hypothetical protein
MIRSHFLTRALSFLAALPVAMGLKTKAEPAVSASAFEDYPLTVEPASLLEPSPIEVSWAGRTLWVVNHKTGEFKEYELCGCDWVFVASNLNPLDSAPQS